MTSRSVGAGQVRSEPVAGAPGHAGDGLVHAIPLVAVALLLVNDHALKAAVPGPLTGKLSDLAGLIVLPLVLVAGLEVLLAALRRPLPGRRSALVVVVLVGAGFAAMKVAPLGGDAYRVGLGLLQWPFRALAGAATGGLVSGPSAVTLVADPTDVVVLPILLVPLAMTITRASTAASTVVPRVRARVDAFSLTVAVLATLLLLGAVVDGWAHTHVASSLETVLTPWHGLLYATSAALYAVLGAWALAHWDGRSLRRAIPAGHGITYVGALVFGLAGLGDTLWHLAFGIEADAEALVSPTHLALGIGAGLVALGPVRATVLRRDSGQDPVGRLPLVLGLGAVTGLVAFATHLAHPLVDPWPLYPVARYPDPMWAIPALGIAGVALQSAVLAGGAVALERLWPRPASGALAAVVIVSQAPLVILHDRSELLVTVLVAAAAVDVAASWLRSRLGRPSIVAIAALVPFAVFGLELVQLADRIRWSAHLLGGWLVVSATVGALVGGLGWLGTSGEAEATAPG